MDEFIEVPAYRAGVALRPWLPELDYTRSCAAITLKMAAAGPATRRLLNGDDVSTEDLAAFGRLNWAAVSLGWEPLVELHRDPVLDPDLAEFLRALPEKVWR